jgi:hypothetical protein
VLEAIGQIVMDPAREVVVRGADDELVELALVDCAVDGVERVAAGFEAGDVLLRRAPEQARGLLVGPIGMVALLGRDQHGEAGASARTSADLGQQRGRRRGAVGDDEDSCHFAPSQVRVGRPP